MCPKCGKRRMVKGNVTKAGKLRWMCRSWVDGKHVYCYSTVDPTQPAKDRRGGRTSKDDTNPQFRRKLSGIKRFIITSAQNATPLHDDFFSCLKTYSDHMNAELVVIPLRYKNPTSRWEGSQQNEEWWAVGDEYLYNQRKKLNENLMLLGDIKTVPTATNPLSGFEALTHGESGILGHTKVQMQCIATPQGKYPKIMTTTGACTLPNYTDSKAGKKGEFHHTLGAVVVEIIGKKFFLRHVSYDSKSGSFTDLTNQYTPHEVKQAPRPHAVVFGDTHRAVMDKTVEKVTFGPGGIVDTLDPEYLVFHDLHDGASTNHHTKKDPFAQIAKVAADLHLVEKEVRDDVEWLKQVCQGRQGVIVPSNHDDFLARWLREQDWRTDPHNSEFYLETALHLVREVKSGNVVPHPFTHWVNKLKGDAPITCLERDESFMLGGVELSLHGDKGPNGARGSLTNLRRIGVKTMIGHSHTPGINEGCWQVGTSTPLQLDYNTGPSSWMNCHGVIHASGKRQLLFIIDGAWRLDD